MKTIAFVPVRQGSKSIINKNIKQFYGKPLVFWVLNALQDCKDIDRIILATDGREIEQVVNSFCFDKVEIYWRNPENASDTASTESVMLEFIEKSNLDLNAKFILAQATSPFTTSNDFSCSIAQFEKSKADSLLSVVRQKRFYWNLDNSPLNYDFTNRPRRQDFEGLFMENGAIYISTIRNIINSSNRLNGKVTCYEMPDHTGLELDEEIDWEIGESLMKKYGQNNIHHDPSKIKLVLSDVDGVLTDAGMYYSELGDELKKFNTYDGMAFKLMKNKGIKVGIITSEDCNLNRRRAEKLKLDFQFHGTTNKLQTVQELLSELNISFSEVAYIGDDINDFDILNEVGFAFCPNNARKEILAIPKIIKLQSNGGSGAIRELYEKWIQNV